MPVRRLGLIGDVHAEDERLERALSLLREEGVDAIACVGDVVDGPGDVERCVALLEEHRAITVRGNHERWLLRNFMRDLPDAHFLDRLSASTQAWIAGLPATRSIETIAGRALLCHGLGEDDMEGVMPWDTEADLQMNSGLRALARTRPEGLVVNGHTHRRMVRAVDRRRVIVNAGTLFREHDPCVGLLDIAAWECRFWRIGADLSVAPEEAILLP